MHVLLHAAQTDQTVQLCEQAFQCFLRRVGSVGYNGSFLRLCFQFRFRVRGKGCGAVADDVHGVDRNVDRRIIVLFRGHFF